MWTCYACLFNRTMVTIKLITHIHVTRNDNVHICPVSSAPLLSSHTSGSPHPFPSLCSLLLFSPSFSTLHSISPFYPPLHSSPRLLLYPSPPPSLFSSPPMDSNKHHNMAQNTPIALLQNSLE